MRARRRRAYKIKYNYNVHSRSVHAAAFVQCAPGPWLIVSGGGGGVGKNVVIVLYEKRARTLWCVCESERGSSGCKPAARQRWCDA